MSKEEISKQLELYSNSIIAFIAVQSLIFCYNFGTSEFFNCILKNTKGLSVFLAGIFFFAYVLAWIAHYRIFKMLKELNGEYSQIVKSAYIGKFIAICVFFILQMVVIGYAISGK
ncbi:MAG: hypothetical protein C0390_07690 [Syntrophus sp. (in: bacteria)]|nr:hypothetical protein [Syntrophus sp. (in: bacteria)]